MKATVLNPRKVIPNRANSGANRVVPQLLRGIALGCKFSLVAISLLAAIVSFGQTSSSSALGTIQGVVLDPTGKPLPDADVYVITDTSTSRWEYVSAVSDAKGSFILNALPQGSYYVYSRKINDGYADDFFALSATNPPHAMVNVVAGETTKTVIQRGPKCASLNLYVTDENGMPKTDYTLDFYRPDLGTSGGFGTSAEFPHGPKDPPMQADWPRGLKPLPVLVPLAPFRLTVNADGYEPWHYGGAKWQGNPGLITLKSGQTLNLTVRLRKK